MHCSPYRLLSLQTYHFLGNYVNAAIFTAIEPNVAVISACLPTLRPLYRLVSQKLTVLVSKPSLSEKHEPDLPHVKTGLRGSRAKTFVRMAEDGGWEMTRLGPQKTTTDCRSDNIDLESQVDLAILPEGTIHVKRDIVSYTQKRISRT